MARLIAAVVLLVGALQDVNFGKILEKADALIVESKAAYEKARSTSSVSDFVEAGFKLEEARIKYLVLQEIGDADKQKLAGDRLRAVNQLNKLINDGKVAVMNPPAPKPADPAAPAIPDPAPAPAAPAPAPVDVSRRAPIPDAAKQKDAEKLVRDLFKADYAKRGVVHQRALAKRLLDEASKSQDDPPGVWVLYREAEDLAAQAGDVDTAMLAVSRRAELFDVDPIQQRAAALASTVKSVKVPEDAAALAEAHLRHVDELVGADQYDAADKAAAAAVAQAKKANDAGLWARTATRAKQVGEMKSLFLTQKKVLDKLARDGEDPGANLEMGKYLCFVKGSWDLGLRFMVKGSDPALKALADKELAFPQSAADQAALADGWFDLGDKDKSPLRKSQLLGHARAIYETALPSATGLMRAKIEKRLSETSEAAAPVAAKAAVNLMTLIDPAMDSVAGTWKLERGELRGSGAERARIQIPYAPPEEYDLTIVAEQVSGSSNLLFGLSRPGTQWVVSYDNEINGAYYSGLVLVDGKLPWENPTSKTGRFLKKGTMQTFEFKVRKSGVTTFVDGKQVLSWQDYSRLTMAQRFQIHDKTAMLFGMYNGEAKLLKATLLPVSGQGKPLR
jgi:hypothetical protein